MLHNMDMEKSITPIVLTFIGLIIVGVLLIPFLLELTHEPDIQAGDTISYSPRTSIDAEITYGGTLLDHSTYVLDGNKITITTVDEGTFTLVVTATTHHPEQTAVQTITVEVGEYSKYHDYKPMLLLVPTMLFVGFMLLLLGRKGGDSGGFGEIGYSGGGDIAGRFGRFGGR